MFKFQVQVYYEDTDFSGFVYHANYLKYCERARSAYLRDQGVDQNAMFAEGMTFVVCKIDCEFLRPAKFDDELVVETSIHRMSGARLELYDTDGAKGAALGAGVGAGIFKTFPEAFRGLKMIRHEEPDTNKTQQYTATYQNWKTQLNKLL